MEKIIDTHAHYNVRQFNTDRTKLLTDLYRNKNIQTIINCGTNTKTNKEVIQLTNDFSFCKAVIGYFPCDVVELEESPEKLTLLANLLNKPNVVGVGEIGLDYHWDKPSRNIQKYWFKEQIKIANKAKVPVCIHSRDAELDTLNILRALPIIDNKIMHSFSYGPEAAATLVKMDFFFGVGGMCTYKGNQIDAAIKKSIPLTRILLETDCPYLTPVPYRQERNDSSYLIHVARHLAEIYGHSVDEIIKQTTENAKLAYHI